MVKKFVATEPQKWDVLLCYFLFAIQEVPKSTIGLSLFEFLYGGGLQGKLDLLQEAWQKASEISKCNVVCSPAMGLARSCWGIHSRKSPTYTTDPRAHYNALVQVYQPGDLVYLLLPCGSQVYDVNLLKL